jgi:plastocyanin
MRAARMSVLATVVVMAVLVTATVALAATRSVSVRKDGSRWLFSPRSLSISTGDTVRWSWRGNAPHNVTGSGFASRTANRLTYSRRFSRAGTYRVRCTIHADVGQRMTIRVR